MQQMGNRHPASITLSRPLLSNTKYGILTCHIGDRLSALALGSTLFLINVGQEPSSAGAVLLYFIVTYVQRSHF